MSKNIAVIRAVEYEKSGFFFPVGFVSGSASLSVSRQRSNAGTLYKASLQFRISEIKTRADEMIERLHGAERIALEDVNGTRIILGSGDHPVKVESEQNIAGHPGGFIGYEVSVSWEHPFPPGKQSFI